MQKPKRYDLDKLGFLVSDRWRVYKQIVGKRSGYRCEFCKIRMMDTAHHRINERPGYGYDNFDLTNIEGSYDMSLYGLVHYIMYEEGIYKQFLNPQEYSDLEKTIETEPEAIYRPDYDENEPVNELLDNIYWYSIEFVAQKLKRLNFDVESIFSEGGFLEEE